MNDQILNQSFFDSEFPPDERLPRCFDVEFKQYSGGSGPSVQIAIDGNRVGDEITNNSFLDDSYRFHDVFHFSYVAVLGWSPCVRKMLKRKRKSDARVDEVEDGARAIIAEEAISLLVFSYANDHCLFVSEDVNPTLLDNIERLADNFEVRVRSRDDWRRAISMGYKAFGQLVANRAGKIRVDMGKRELSYIGDLR